MLWLIALVMGELEIPDSSERSIRAGLCSGLEGETSVL